MTNDLQFLGLQRVRGPSVLFDAVAVIAAPDGARALADSPAARDFMSDGYAHCKFIAYTSGTAPLLKAAGLNVSDGALDDRLVSLDEHSAKDFITRCRQLRFWERQQPAK